MTNSNLYLQDIAQERMALRVCARLSDAADDLPYDLSERLRAARVQALSKRKILVKRTAQSISSSGDSASLTLGGDYLNVWERLAAMLPLLALVMGLITINLIQEQNSSDEIAEIDAALLTDDLPPSAYADQGFAQFIKINSPSGQ
jgi:hypothetical protein